MTTSAGLSTKSCATSPKNYLVHLKENTQRKHACHPRYSPKELGNINASQSTFTSDPHSGDDTSRWYTWADSLHKLLTQLASILHSTAQSASIPHNQEKRGPSHLHTTATCGFMPAISGTVQVGSHWARNGIPCPWWAQLDEQTLPTCKWPARH
jgi:hypothetical protein